MVRGRRKPPRDSRDRFIGLDIGSTSINVVIVDDARNILFEKTERHRGEPIKGVHTILSSLFEDVPQASIQSISVTGSAGKLIAHLLNATFVNEIIAHSRAVAHLYPFARSIIEIGGQDAKLIRLRQSKGDHVLDIEDFAMNSVCSAGTGSFLDQQAFRLGIDIADFGRLALIAESVPRLAGRCSVFAKSDMIHLQQIGVQVPEIVAGLCFALARNFVSVLSGGRDIEKPIVFQGGVSENLGIRKAFKEILCLREEDLIIPKYHLSMGAIGAVYRTMEDPGEAVRPSCWDLGPLERALQEPSSESRGLRNPLQRPVPSGSSPRRGVQSPPRRSRSGRITAYLGIDVGSVSTNLVLIDERRNVIVKEYLRTRGKPIEAVMTGLRAIERKIGRDVEIAGVGVTGSGRYMIGELVGADVIRNEITAQATAALSIDPTVDTVFEIGGQDSKYIRIEDGVVVDFNMNHACAAGTGSFLEEQAENLGIAIDKEFSEAAFRGEAPVPLAEKCTVFIESDLIHFQQTGAKKENVLAGLSYAIVQNYIHKVVKTGTIGKNVFFQGGVAFNKAVVAAFGEVTGVRITVPEHHEVTGAIGAAIIAQEECRGKTTAFRGFGQCRQEYEIRTFQCTDCENNCEINSIAAKDDKPLFYGSRCGKYDVSKGPRVDPLPDLFAEREQFLLHAYEKRDAAPGPAQKKRIGIPRVVLMHEFFPLFNAFFSELGCEVVLSDKTNESIIKTGTERAPAEFCFPIKIVFGHVHNLLQKGVDAVFLPSIRSLRKSDPEQAHSWSCVWVQALPYTVQSAVDFEKENVELLKPVIWFDVPDDRIEKAFLEIGRRLGRRDKAVLDALNVARAAQERFYERCLARGREVLARLGADEIAIVIVSRSYNGNDSRVNLDVPKKLRRMGIRAIPMDFLPIEQLSIPLHEETINWKSGQRIIKAAKIIREDERLFAIYITNFNCGPDSFILHYFREHLAGKPFLELEVDEHSSDTGAITRCEAFVDSLMSYRRKRQRPRPRVRYARPIDKTLTIYIPQADCINRLATLWQAGHRAFGLDLRLFPPSTRETLDLARQFTTGKECYPYQLVVGDMVRLLRDPAVDKKNLAIMIPTTPGACRLVGYPKGLRSVLDRLGYPEVPILAVTKRFKEAQVLYRHYARIEKLIYLANTCNELVLKKVRELRPYEVNKGETDRVYDSLFEELLEVTRDRGPFLPFLKKARERLMNIPTRDPGSKPLIAIVGEIYVRLTPFANNYLEEEILRLGGEPLFVPLREELFFRNFYQFHWAWINRSYTEAFKWFAIDRGMRLYEWCYERMFNGDFRNRPDSKTVAELQRLALPFVDRNFWGITVASIGSLLEGIERNLYDGVISIGPFSCMPTTVVHALSKLVQDKKGRFPYLLFACEGLEQTNIVTRLEAFMYQAKEHWRLRNT